LLISERNRTFVVELEIHNNVVKLIRYLIGGILIKSLEQENNLSSIWKFRIKRGFRILPVYYLMLAIKYFFFDDSVGVNILYYIFFLQNNFYSLTWSLVIEEWVYLLAPIYMYIIFKLFKLKKIDYIVL